MKTFYFFLILLFSFSFANAQSIETKETQTTVVAVKESKEVTSKATIILEPSIIKEAVARSSSDIRIYLNRERKVQNIKLLFPKINKARKA
ncbi:hypothetical protein GCM10022291_04640 [Postechiella marina]|uniref:TonB-dependent receptor n=1 Tax=Postechiella marina TaxID=943941 RepID=A0ABP8C152_9FLAO